MLDQTLEILNQMVLAGRDMTYSMVRKFVVNFYNLDLADFILYSAMKAPNDSIFFENRRTSENWALIDANKTRHQIQNPQKYQWQLRFTLNSVVAAGASYLSAADNLDSLTRSATAAYYRMMKEDGSH